jgi:hypothetical protein
MGEPVKQSGGELVAAKNLHPLTKRQVRSYDGGAALVAVGQQVKEQLASRAVKGHKPKLVDDEQGDAVVALVQPPEAPVVSRLQETADQVCRPW